MIHSKQAPVIEHNASRALGERRLVEAGGTVPGTDAVPPQPRGRVVRMCVGCGEREPADRLQVCHHCLYAA